MLTDILNAPAEGNFYDHHCNAMKPIIVEDHKRNMGYIDKSGRHLYH